MDATLLFRVRRREDTVDGIRERDFRLDTDIQPLGIVAIVAIRGNANLYPRVPYIAFKYSGVHLYEGGQSLTPPRTMTGRS